MQRLVFCILLFLVWSCENRNEQILHTENGRRPIVVLQPLHFADTAMLTFLKDSIEQVYPVAVEISTPKQFPLNTYYKPRNRYRADSTINWLKQIKPASAITIVGLTTKDISVTKSKQADFGVMGLGYKPGDACVVSTWRLKKTAKSAQQMRERLFKVVVHEMGHNFSLDHCADQQCIMVDAEEKMKLDEINGLCNSCKQKLKIKRPG